LKTWALDPFGLFGATGPSTPEITIVVHPAPETGASWNRQPSGEGSEEEEGDLLVGARDGAGELCGIRPYVVGDRLTLIHWPARARFGAWFVRQFAPERGEVERLCIDDRAGVHRRSDFERMLRIAQGLLDEGRREGRTVELGTLSGISVLLPPVPASFEVGRLALAALQPRKLGSNPGREEVGARIPGDGLSRGGLLLTTDTGAQSLSGALSRHAVRA